MASAKGAKGQTIDSPRQVGNTNVLRVDTFCVPRPCRVHFQRGTIAVTTLNLKVRQTGFRVVAALLTM
jgi:hypothetical protein